MIQTIGIVGGGAWGTALAQAVRLAGRDAVIWALEPDTVEAINQGRGNPVYLPDIALDPGISATGDIAIVAQADVLLLVTPVQHSRAVLQLRGQARVNLLHRNIVGWCCSAAASMQLAAVCRAYK